MRALVLNLTRFGDLIQTQPLLSLLSRRGYEVGLACLENFAAELLNDVAVVHPLPGARLLARRDSDWRRLLSELDRFTCRIQGFAPDLLVNVTPSLSARLLSRMLPARERRGFCLDPMGFGIYSSPWAAFLQASSRYRGQSPFNLVDLLIKVGHLEPEATPAPLAQTGECGSAMERLRRMSPVQARGFIGFQLGASEDRRRWPVEFFSRLGRALWEKHALLPVLLGSPAESRLGERYARTAAPCLDLIGRTDLKDLAGLLRGMELLVTNDTGTMHLAAGLNVPVAAFFLATAQPWDTGPYLEGCLCLEPDLECHPCAFGSACHREEACRRCIGPQEVLHQLESFLTARRWTRPQESGVRAWVTGRDAAGFMGLEPLSGHADTDRGAWILMQRHFYRHFLDEKGCAPFPATTGRLSPPALARMAATLGRARDLLVLLAGQGELLGRSSHIQRKFLATWQTLATILAEDPNLAVLSGLWITQTQEQGLELDSLRRTIASYRTLFEALLLRLDAMTRHDN